MVCLCATISRVFTFTFYLKHTLGVRGKDNRFEDQQNLPEMRTGTSVLIRAPLNEPNLVRCVCQFSRTRAHTFWLRDQERCCCHD